MQAIPPRPVDGVFRLPLDRAFSAKGFGTIAAGIPVAGSASLGDEVVLLPQNVTGRIRRIEVYGQQSDTVLAGQCAADQPGALRRPRDRPGRRADAARLFRPGGVLPLPTAALAAGRERTPLKNAVELKFHTGTSEVNATLYLLRAGRAPRQRRTFRPTPHQAAGGRRAGRSLHPADLLAGPHHRRRPDHRGHRRAG